MLYNYNGTGIARQCPFKVPVPVASVLDTIVLLVSRLEKFECGIACHVLSGKKLF